jgi:hypothetical protein
MLSPRLAYPKHRLSTLDPGVSCDLSAELGCEIKEYVDLKLSNIAQQNRKRHINVRVARATS